MKVLVAGASGFIGRSLVDSLKKQGHEVFLLNRSVCDLVHDIPQLPQDLEAAYYLVHGMHQRHQSLFDVEQQQVEHFIAGIKKTRISQIVYLGGLAPGKVYSDHLRSRLNVESQLSQSGIPLTSLRASVIVGEGSTSFEMIRYLTERLPIMITPHWVKNKSQPISLEDVLFYLIAVLGNRACYGQTFDIGGPDVMTFQQMLIGYAKARNLKRLIFSVPFVALKPSYLWVTLFSPANRYIAKSLVHSLRGDFVCTNEKIHEIFNHHCQSYVDSIQLALKIDPVPRHGVNHYEVVLPFEKSPEAVADAIWSIGGKKGWYYMNWAWKLRGKIDSWLGGIGFRLGRKKEVKEGDNLDFWKVLKADRKTRELLLFAEMLMPGEAWLNFKIISYQSSYALVTCATFRPKGLGGATLLVFTLSDSCPDFPRHGKINCEICPLNLGF